MAASRCLGLQLLLLLHSRLPRLPPPLSQPQHQPQHQP